MIDLHYLLGQVHHMQTVLLPALISGGDSELEISNQLNLIQVQINIWSQNKQSPDRGAAERNQKVLRLRWREQALKVRERLLAKIAAKKKDDAYARKRLRIKHK